MTIETTTTAKNDEAALTAAGESPEVQAALAALEQHPGGEIVEDADASGDAGDADEEGGEEPLDPKAKYFKDTAREEIFSKRSRLLAAGTPGDEGLAAGSRELSGPDLSLPPSEGDGAAAGANADGNGSTVSAAPAAKPSPTAATASAPVRVAQSDEHASIQEQIRAARDSDQLRQNQILATENRRLAAELEQSRRNPAPPTGEAGAGDPPAQAVMDALMRGESKDFAESLVATIKSVTAAATPSPQPATNVANPAPLAPATSRTVEARRLANIVFETQFAAVLGNDAAFEAARSAMTQRMDDPQYAAVPLDLLVRDIGYSVAKQFDIDLQGSAVPVSSAGPASGKPAVDPAREKLEARRTAKQRLPRALPSAPTAAPASTSSSAESVSEKRSNYVQQLQARSGSNSAIRARPRA